MAKRNFFSIRRLQQLQEGATLQSCSPAYMTKKQMIAVLNGLLKKFYGCETKLTAKVEAYPAERIKGIFEAVWLWRNDPLNEQIKTLEEWVRN